MVAAMRVKSPFSKCLVRVHCVVSCGLPCRGISWGSERHCGACGPLLHRTTLYATRWPCPRVGRSAASGRCRLRHIPAVQRPAADRHLRLVQLPSRTSIERDVRLAGVLAGATQRCAFSEEGDLHVVRGRRETRGTSPGSRDAVERRVPLHGLLHRRSVRTISARRAAGPPALPVRHRGDKMPEPERRRRSLRICRVAVSRGGRRRRPGRLQLHSVARCRRATFVVCFRVIVREASAPSAACLARGGRRTAALGVRPGPPHLRRRAGRVASLPWDFCRACEPPLRPQPHL